MISWEEYAIEQRRVVKVYWLRFVFKSLLLFLYLNFSKYKISTKSIGAFVPLLINKMLVMAIYLDCLGLKILRCFAGISAKAPSVVSFWRYFLEFQTGFGLLFQMKLHCTGLSDTHIQLFFRLNRVVHFLLFKQYEDGWGNRFPYRDPSLLLPSSCYRSPHPPTSSIDWLFR